MAPGLINNVEEDQAAAAWMDPGLDLCTFNFKLLIFLILTTLIFRPRAFPKRSLEGCRDSFIYNAVVFDVLCIYFETILSLWLWNWCYISRKDQSLARTPRIDGHPSYHDGRMFVPFDFLYWSTSCFHPDFHLAPILRNDRSCHG